MDEHPLIVQDMPVAVGVRSPAGTVSGTALCAVGGIGVIAIGGTGTATVAIPSHPIHDIVMDPVTKRALELLAILAVLVDWIVEIIHSVH